MKNKIRIVEYRESSKEPHTYKAKQIKSKKMISVFFRFSVSLSLFFSIFLSLRFSNAELSSSRVFSALQVPKRIIPSGHIVKKCNANHYSQNFFPSTLDKSRNFDNFGFAFIHPLRFSNRKERLQQRESTLKQSKRIRGALFASGYGQVGNEYSWVENDWEVDITIPLEKDTRKDDILFKLTPTSIKIGQVGKASLLLGGRLRGKVTLDGSYWQIEKENNTELPHLKILLEKQDMEASNRWDWEGILMDDEEKITFKKYQPHEKMDVKQYTHDMLGTESIDETLVDKSLFNVGIDETKEDLVKEWSEQGVVIDDTIQTNPTIITSPSSTSKEDEGERREVNVTDIEDQSVYKGDESVEVEEIAQNILNDALQKTFKQAFEKSQEETERALKQVQAKEGKSSHSLEDTMKESTESDFEENNLNEMETIDLEKLINKRK